MENDAALGFSESDNNGYFYGILKMETVFFYIFAAALLACSAGVLCFRNPLYSVLSLVSSMMVVAFIFFLLKNPFIASVQLIVYAGAVLVLFLMVVMLFDLKKEMTLFSHRKALRQGSFVAVGWFLGLVIGVMSFFRDSFLKQKDLQTIDSKKVAIELFSNHVLSFEVVGILLLIVAVGAATLARMKGEKNVH